MNEANGSPVGSAAGWNVSADAGKLAFEADGVVLEEAVFRVVLLIGADEREWVWTPPGPADEVRHAVRHTPAGAAHDTSWSWHDAVRGYGFTWSVSVLPQQSAFTLRAGFTNWTDEPVRLHHFVLCGSPDEALACEGDAGDWLLSSLEYNSRVGYMNERLISLNDETIRTWKGFNMPVPFDMPQTEQYTDGRWRIYPEHLTLYSQRGNRGIACGAVGEAEADVRFECKVADSGSGRSSLHIISDMSDIRVDPGESRRAQEVAVIAGPCEAAVETLLRWVAATHGSRTHRGALANWNSWYDLHAHITEQSIADSVDSFVRFKDRLPLQVIQIDDGYQKHPGDWSCNDRFPHGLSPLVERVRAAGAEPGIWLAPLAVHDDLGLPERHPEWFQHKRDGNFDGEANNWGPVAHWLDPTHPEAQQFLRGIIRQMKAQGFNYYKIDFNYLGVACRFHDPKKTRLQVFRDLYRLYREEMGEGAYLVACSQLVRGVFGYADATRIGPDSSAVWEALHTCSIKESIRAVGMNAGANGILGVNDPDTMYAVIPKFPNAVSATRDEIRTWQGFIGLLGGTIQFGDAMYGPAFPEQIGELEIMMPPAPDRGRALHPGADKEHRRFGFVAERPWGVFAAVQLWNPEPEPQAIALQPTGRLSLLGERFHAWSFRDERYLGIVDGAAFRSQPLPSHHAQLLRFTALLPDENLPVLVGSTLHIGMGSAEIAGLAVTRRRLGITLHGHAGAGEGKLAIHSRRPLRLAGFAGCASVALTQDGGGAAGANDAAIWTVRLTGRQRDAQQHIILHVE